MTGPFDEELLSAYHDGELNDAERQPFADRVAEDAGLREVLDEYGELSSSLKSLPRPDAPADLREAVMGQVRSQPAALPKQQTSPPSRRVFWLWSAGTAASVLLAVGLVWIGMGGSRHGEMRMGDVASNAESGAAPSAAMTATFDEVADAAPNGRGGFGGGGPIEMALDASAVPAPDAPAVRAPTEAELADNDRRLRDLLRSLADDLVRGQELQLLREVGGELQVAVYRVIDIVETLGDVDVLLKPVENQSLATGVRASPGPGNRLCGVFLQARHDQLLSAIEENGLGEQVLLVDAGKEPAADDAERDAADYQEELELYAQVLRSMANEVGREQSRQAIGQSRQSDEQPDDARQTVTPPRFLIVFIEEEDLDGN